MRKYMISRTVIIDAPMNKLIVPPTFAENMNKKKMQARMLNQIKPTFMMINTHPRNRKRSPFSFLFEKSRMSQNRM